ncbi:regulatory protein [Streptomyces bingchenggensis BCW-1]|uniref:Regulatory protein n=1 Tax=Streptomyces bingchenggensis (strain BCW-1) TaxID=749414 RepID=D7C2W2_STRBB|nr:MULTISPECIES: ATP-binding protein [Streptomyces]ADI05995.1 regulatory protein [Streptomyces bingchenggensis BCW-1]
MAVADQVTDEQRLSYTWQLAVKLDDLAHYRRLASAAMRKWKQPCQVSDTVLLAVTELLSNVHRHAESPRCSLEIAKKGPSIYVNVSDRSPTPPVVSRPDWIAETGRGLWLLRELADDFGYEPTPDGKKVWIRIDTVAEQEEPMNKEPETEPCAPRP